VSGNVLSFTSLLHPPGSSGHGLYPNIVGRRMETSGSDLRSNYTRSVDVVAVVLGEYLRGLCLAWNSLYWKCISPDTGQNLLCWQVLERDFLLTYYHCLKTIVLNVQASRFCLLLPHLEQFIKSWLGIDKDNKWTTTILLLSCQFTFVHRNTSPLENLTINACNVAHLPS